MNLPVPFQAPASRTLPLPRRCSPGRALLLGLALWPACTLWGLQVEPQPDPGLAVSVRAADVIAEVEVLAGGPFRAAVQTRRIWRGQPPKLFELEGINSLNGNTARGGFRTGSRYILFLSRTGRNDRYATLTPTAPRLAVEDGSILLTLGDPPFRLPVKEEALHAVLELLLARQGTERVPEGGLRLIQDLWGSNEIESRYLAVACAGFLGESGALPLLAEAANQQLLQLRLTAIQALKALGSHGALEVLRRLLSDARFTVSREAAQALLELEDLAALEPVLKWLQTAAQEKAKQPKGDLRAERIRQVTQGWWALLERRGVQLESARLLPALLELARHPDGEIAGEALNLLGRLAGRAEITRLLELAEDPQFGHTRAAKTALFMATLRPAEASDRFGEWWRENQAAYGEDLLRGMVEAAAQAFRRELPRDEREGLARVLYEAPPEIALVSTAPLLLDAERAGDFETYDLLRWDSPLAVPFLIERLGRDESSDRSSAILALASQARRHPRLGQTLAPLLRAGFSDGFSAVRRAAATAAGLLEDSAALPKLLNALLSGGYEAAQANRTVYRLTARTLGYWDHEPAPDLEAAALRLAGWWQALGPEQARWRSPFPAPLRPAPRPEPSLEGLCQSAESRRSGQAFSLLLGERPPGDPFWRTLLQASRLRDKAYGIMGLWGAGEEELQQTLGGLVEPLNPRPGLLQAHAILALAARPGGKGGAWLARWLAEGAGQKASPVLKRLAVLGLGLCSGEPTSLRQLATCLRPPVEGAKPADTTDPAGAAGAGGAAEAKAASEDLALAALLALCARADSSAELTQVLALPRRSLREGAARELLARDYRPGIEGVLKALGESSTEEIREVTLLVAPLLTKEHLPRLREMLAQADEVPRIVAAWLFARRWDLVVDEQTRSALQAALADSSPFVRARAAELQGRLRNRAALPALMALLGNPDSDLQSSAAEAVAEIGDREACLAAADEAKLLYRLDTRWIRALGRCGREAELKQLLRYTRSEQWVEQRVGIDGLGVCERPEALARLLELCRNEESAFRTHAADALALQGEAAVTELAADLRSKDPKVRGWTLHVLSRIRVPATVPVLLQGLRDEVPALRALAHFGLQRLSGLSDIPFDPQGAPGAAEAAARLWQERITPQVLEAARQAEALGH